MRVHGIVVVALLLGVRTRLASPEPPAPRAPTPVEAAGDVIKAVDAKDAGLLETLARRTSPDPWLVADALLVQGARAAAEAFSTAAPGKDTEKLPAFVKSWTSTEADVAARKALELGNAALQEKRFADALGAFDASPAKAMAYLRARVAYGGCLALAGLGRSADASARFGTTAIDLETLGWLSRAAEALLQCARHAGTPSNPALALDPLKRLVRLETSRANPLAIARAWNAVGYVQGQTGRWDEAVDSHTHALDVLTERQERALMADALISVAWAEVHRGRTKEAQAAASRGQGISELMGLPALTARGHEVLGMADLVEGKLGDAEIAFGEAVKTALAVGDPALLARMRNHLGSSRADLGDYEGALEPLKASLDAFEAIDPASGRSVTLARARYAWGLALAGRVADARAAAERAAHDAADGDRLLKGLAGWAEGILLGREDRAEDAVRTLTTAGAHLEASGELDDSLRVVAAIAEIRRGQRKLPEARAAADSALEGARRFPRGLALPTALGVSARVMLDQGQAAAALPLAEEARDLFGRMRHSNGVNAMGKLIAEIETAKQK